MKLPIHLFIAAAFLAGCSSAHHHAEEGHDEHHEHSDDEIVLHAHEAEELGVATTTVSRRPLSTVVKVAGEAVADASSQAVVVAPSAGVVTFAKGITEGSAVRAGQAVATVSDGGLTGGDANRTAAINLRAAKDELDRITPLREAGIVTVQEYNNARNAYEQALNAAGTASGAAVAPITGVVTDILIPAGSHVDHGAPIATVTSTAAGVVVRADIPTRLVTRVKNSTRALVTIPDAAAEPIEAVAITGPAAVASAGYMPLYFRLTSVPDNLVAGTYVDVAVDTGVTSPEVIAVPLSAITEKMGRKFVYVRVDDDGYTRREVTTGNDDGRFVEILSGLDEGDDVVTDGVIYVRLAENAGAAIPGHSHEH